MNYRHAFHAGNFADVVKHAALCLILDRLAAKDKPFTVLDSHAGAGVYDLGADAATRTGEHRDGIGRILADPSPPPGLATYLRIVRDLNSGADVRLYPGSPEIVRRLLRPHDQLLACELHPDDHALLAAHLRGDARVRTYALDGYQALRSFLPPKPRRGLVLVDPPFEMRDEFDHLVAALGDGCRKWASGIFLVWYPIKDRAAVARFHGEVAILGIARLLRAELMVRQSSDRTTFDGCGLLIVNPPWKLDDELRGLLPDLARRLAFGPGAGWRLDWLSGEQTAEAS
jgi:23S rRNA (adenine2030-N6)-methyltransferase